jgi:hypothetical protein
MPQKFFNHIIENHIDQFVGPEAIIAEKNERWKLFFKTFT